MYSIVPENLSEKPKNKIFFFLEDLKLKKSCS
jgi:hypothetical protein